MSPVTRRARPGRAVWINYASAALWLILGIVSFPLGWASSVVLVWIASAYANVKTDVGAAIAADDGAVLNELPEVKAMLAALRTEVRALTAPPGEEPPCS